MGPPPCPPPPPTGPLPSSGGWKTANAPRRNNNPAPAPSVATRPHVDSAALQHAAQRLRKTGYNESLRSDKSNIPYGRVAGEDQQLPRRDRPDGEKQRQLEFDCTRETIHAPSVGANVAGSLGNVHRHAVPLNVKPTATVSPKSTTSPVYSSISNYDSTPKSLYNSFNNPTSDQFINKQNVDNSSTYSITATNSLSNNRNIYSQPTNMSKPAVYDDKLQNNNDYSNPYSSQQSRVKETSFEYTTPYQPNASLISDARSRIHDYATNNFVRDDSATAQSNTASAPYGNAYNNSSSYSNTAQYNNSPYSNTAQYTSRAQYNVTTDNNGSEYAQLNKTLQPHNNAGARKDFAKSLRDSALTATQRQANESRQTTMRNEGLPFDATNMFKQAFRGDEVDELMLRMTTDMSTGSRTMDKSAGARTTDMSAGSRTSGMTSTTSGTTRTTELSNGIRTTTTARSNICVACREEITNKKPGCTALDQVYHVACFCCKSCSKILAGSSFFNIDGAPVCDTCYQDTLEKCSACEKPIADKLLRAMGGTYHVHCFACTHCFKPLDGIPFTTDSDNKVHCVPCFHDKYAPRCALCHKAIIPQDGEKESVRVVAMDKSYHVDCYRCEDCGLQLSSKVEGSGCYPIENHLYCKTCNSNRLRIENSA